MMSALSYCFYLLSQQAPTKVYAYSVDVSDEKEMTTAVNDFVAKNGTLDAVIASAGVTNPDYFSNLPVSEFERIMRINYLGCVVTVKAAVPHMKKQATGGRFVLVSSMAGLAGIHGYSAYAPSKYAVRGLAECLAMEFKPYKIYFSVSNPPDVDTPMYAKETATKPEECKLISAGTGVFKPEQLAADILAGLKNYKFFIQTVRVFVSIALLCIVFFLVQRERAYVMGVIRPRRSIRFVYIPLFA